MNAYLREISGEEFTAKDFRTWAGTVLAALALREAGEFTSEAEAKRNVVQAIETVAKRLGNTPAVCRKCYVHPAIIDGYVDGTLCDALKAHAAGDDAPATDRLSPDEADVLTMLRASLSAETDPAS